MSSGALLAGSQTEPGIGNAVDPDADQGDGKKRENKLVLEPVAAVCRRNPTQVHEPNEAEENPKAGEGRNQQPGGTDRLAVTGLTGKPPHGSKQNSQRREFDNQQWFAQRVGRSRFRIGHGNWS